MTSPSWAQRDDSDALPLNIDELLDYLPLVFAEFCHQNSVSRLDNMLKMRLEDGSRSAVRDLSRRSSAGPQGPLAHPLDRIPLT